MPTASVTSMHPVETLKAPSYHQPPKGETNMQIYCMILVEDRSSQTCLHIRNGDVLKLLTPRLQPVPGKGECLRV